MAFVEGFLVGLGMVIFIGPVFFTLLQSTLQFGSTAGIATAFGIFISDVVCVGLCCLGAIPFFENTTNQFWLALGGGFILLVLGLKYIFKPNASLNPETSMTSGSLLMFFTKGFLVNFVNPFVFLVWIGVIGAAQIKYDVSLHLFIFLAASLLGILATDSLKVILAHRIKPFIKENVLKIIYRIIGLLLIGFGIRLLLFYLKG